MTPTLANPSRLPLIPNYTLQAKLGEGGMGEVFLARATDTGERVAIKLLWPYRLALCPDVAQREPARAVSHARTACDLTHWQGWDALRYLAKAYAAAGDLPSAIQTGEQALGLAPELKRGLIQTQLAN